MEDILDRVTSPHTSFATFVDHYLRLSDFPSDVIEGLESGQIDLFEVEQLARITAVVSVSPQAKRTRSELLSSHLQTKAPGERLRQMVNELLRASSAEVKETAGESDAEYEDGLKIGLRPVKILKIYSITRG